MESTFQLASERAELWLSGIRNVAESGRRGDVDTAFVLLNTLLGDYNRHASTLYAVQDRLAALSDRPIKWAAGRGLSGIHPGPGILPHVWSSAHEAALGISRVVIDALLVPLEGIQKPAQQRAMAKQLLSERWQALAIPLDEMADLQERIRRERAKYLQSDLRPQSDDPWLPGETPSECAKRVCKHITTLKRWIDEGKVRRKKLSPRLWRLHRDDVKAVGGRVDN